MIWGSSRAFLMHLMDKQHMPAVVFRRVFGCHCFCFPIKRQSLEVWLQSGIFLGRIFEKFSLSNRTFAIENERGEILYQIEVPLRSALCMPKEHHFRVSLDNLIQTKD
jgi:Scramblase